MTSRCFVCPLSLQLINELFVVEQLSCCVVSSLNHHVSFGIPMLVPAVLFSVKQASVGDFSGKSVGDAGNTPVDSGTEVAQVSCKEIVETLDVIDVSMGDCVCIGVWQIGCWINGWDQCFGGDFIRAPHSPGPCFATPALFSLFQVMDQEVVQGSCGTSWGQNLNPFVSTK